MRILCVADQIDPLVYSASIKDRFGDVDVVLSAGDLPMDYLGFIVTTLNKPVFFIFGNHNLKELSYFQPSFDDRMTNRGYDFENQATSSGAVYLGSKVKKEGNLLFAGLGGSRRYNNGRNQFTDFQMRLQILALVPQLIINRLLHGRFLDILLTHSPPAGIHDKEDPCHRGFSAFLWFMKMFKPRYLIHGHIHLYDLNDVRTTQYDQTLVINAYSHYLINTDAPA
ncbi:MAG: metallophosphoesterase [Treponemataceae bacterium]